MDLKTQKQISLIDNRLNIFFQYYRNKEEELRNSLDPKYAHLSDELHVEVSALAPPTEAYARIAYAFAEVKKYLIPDGPEMMRPPMRKMMDRGKPVFIYKIRLEAYVDDTYIPRSIFNFFLYAL